MARTVGTAVLLAAGLLVACSDPKAANKENFQKVLSAFFGKNCMLIAQGINTFPIQIQVGEPGRPMLQQLLQSDTTARLNALADAGLLTRTPAPEQAVRFDLTSKGRDLYRSPGAMGPFSPSGFCVGHLRIASVDSFTSPAEENGRRISLASIKIRPEFDEWTKAPAVQSAFRNWLHTNSNLESTAVRMVLMNDGWTVWTGKPYEMVPPGWTVWRPS